MDGLRWHQSCKLRGACRSVSTRDPAGDPNRSGFDVSHTLLASSRVWPKHFAVHRVPSTAPDGPGKATQLVDTTVLLTPVRPGAAGQRPSHAGNHAQHERTASQALWCRAIQIVAKKGFLRILVAKEPHSCDFLSSGSPC